MGLDLTALIKKNVGVENKDFKRITSDFAEILPLFMFRRNEGSQWFDHPLVRLPKLEYTTHEIPFPGDCEQARKHMNKAWISEMQRKLQAAVKDWESKPAATRGPKPTKVTDEIFEGCSRKLRIVATLP